ncbi:hypothetical protein C0585_05815 [Candidatus Woesearchaeota archaeon]|nr:MAG: hypothetical protein C0585_05815 [Candidatus Woesearchaeota archaeon]
MIVIGMFLYLAVWLNFYILKKTFPFYLTLLVMISIIILIVATSIKNYVEFANYRYQFFSNRIEFHGKKSLMVYYSQVQSVKIEKNMLDLLFKTGIINLGIMKIRSVPNLTQVYFYVQKMVQINSQYRSANPYQQQYQQRYNAQYSQQQNNYQQQNNQSNYRYQP